MNRYANLLQIAPTILILLAGSVCSTAAEKNTPIEVSILYLYQPVERPPVLSNIQTPYLDAGLRGAQVAISDSNSTGRFLNHHYQLKAQMVENSEQAIQAGLNWLGQGNTLILAHLPFQSLTQLVTAEGVDGKALIFNIAATENELRTTACQTGLLHTIPSRAMLADALAQFLVARKWKRWLLIKGQLAGDVAYAESLKRAAARFGGKIIAERDWRFDTDLRRTAQQELPLFTQADEYDITLVADEPGDVGEYVPYNTWLPRPVAGTQGLTPVAWHAVVEQWGAIQLQNRFKKHAQRPMNDIDYAGWTAVRSIAEATTRTGSNAAQALYTYLFDDNFELAGFKGRKMTFRAWNGQLRQPIPLVQPRALVSQSPQAGFLHPRTELDTLGFDQREVTCPFGASL